MHICFRDRTAAILLAAVFGCLTPILAFAQDSKKLAFDGWRPKDGFYIVTGTELDGACEDSAQYFFELSKKRVTDHVSFGCRVTKIYDTAPGALRLDLSCVNGEGDERRTKEIMTFRRIDDKSFFMRMSNKGRLPLRKLQVDYCPETPVDKWPSAFEIKRDAVQKQLKATEWQPRDGVYATAGADFDDRCMKSGDAVIDLAGISIMSGASRCEVSKVSDATQATIKLEAQCDLKPGETGKVARSIDGKIVFAPVGSEDIVITNSGNQTVTLRKSRGGEFSELGQLLAYCPDTAQRAYTDSKKAK